MLALNNLSNSAAQLTFKTDISRICLHYIFYGMRWWCVAILLMRKINNFIIGIGFDFSKWQCWWWWANTTRLLALKIKRTFLSTFWFMCIWSYHPIRHCPSPHWIRHFYYFDKLELFIKMELDIWDILK